ncbi:hypothetical protein GCM10009785_22220 [Brooklawnia cerclae]|uniref:Alpha/beta hydrolase n=1 Tax=Brooklawnia cerclae TaxID=349934 RepID=A0ABX0SK58_9ACTN|nr:hypothetical protein [Brooklawnia cerclae]NIH57142.1 hypothetical protein [Brooklawnia cerclae]
MDILLLGGQSPRHREWSRAIAASLESHGHRVSQLEYANWLDQTRVTDVEHEVAAVTHAAATLTDPVVVAKSVGTLIATLAIGRGLLHPAGEVFLGLPLEAWADSDEATAYLTDLPPLTVVQNEHDPFGSADDASRFVAAHAPRTYTVEAVPGVSTHDYVDAEAIHHWASDRG